MPWMRPGPMNDNSPERCTASVACSGMGIMIKRNPGGNKSHP
jgi:hypothetical protein